MAAQPDLREPRASLRETQDAATREARDAGWRATAPRQLAAAAAAGLLLGFLGPFGSDAAPYLLRSVYWVLLSVLGTLVGIAVSQLTQRLEGLERRPWLRPPLWRSPWPR